MLGSYRNLPNETLVHIFSHLSQRDLTKVVPVSRRFKVVVERILYSSVDIAEVLTGDSYVPKRALGWCNAVKRNQLYEIPRKLSIRWRISGFAKPKSLLHSCSLVNDNIRRLTLLDTLELFMGPTPSSITTLAVELVIRDLRLPKLRHCLLGAGDPKCESSFGFTPKPGGISMLTSIMSHSRLRYLAVVDISEPMMELVPHDALPELSIFHGTPSGAAFILPGRPVHHLLLTGREDLSSENLSRMALTSVPLRILDLSAQCVSPSVLRHIATHLPTIEIFRVDFKLHSNLLVLSSYLALFKKLSWFDLVSPPVTKGLEMDDQRWLCYDWYSVCPSLRHIFFPCINPYYDAEPLMWERNEDGHWFTCEPPTRESADGLYQYYPRSSHRPDGRFSHPPKY